MEIVLGICGAESGKDRVDCARRRDDDAKAGSGEPRGGKWRAKRRIEKEVMGTRSRGYKNRPRPREKEDEGEYQKRKSYFNKRTYKICRTQFLYADVRL
jgi:hypothetical protein